MVPPQEDDEEAQLQRAIALSKGEEAKNNNN